jgi:protein involved in polysaccharide export with SLBB domain
LVTSYQVSRFFHEAASIAWFRARRLTPIAAISLLAWVVLITPTATSASAQPVAAADQASTSAKSPAIDLDQIGHRATKQQFEVGDRLKISFYEHLGSEDSKWGNSAEPTKPDRSFYLHPEISGDYTIQSDGTISFPIIGDVEVTGRSSAQANAELSASFEKAIGRHAFVNAILLERSPIYIIGPVKQPGVYKFQNGMTAFHAVALAGGFERSENERWSILDALRENGNVTAATSRLKHLLAQWAVIHAESSNTDVVVPDRLVDLAGPREATSLIKEEKAQRAEIIRLRGQTEQTLSSAVSAAQRQLDVANDRLAPLQSGVQLQKARYAGVQKLFDGGRIDRVFLIQAQGDLSAAEDRQASARSEVEKATVQLVIAKIEAAKFQTKTITDLNQEAADRQREIGQLAPTLLADTGMLDVMKLSDSRHQSDDTLKFEIIRSTSSGPGTLAAEGTTLLHPGDLVRVERKPDLDLERQAYTTRSGSPQAVQ